MPRIDIDEWIDESTYHPCIHCGCEEFYCGDEGLSRCLDCDHIMEAPKPNKKIHKTKKVKKFKLDDWD